MRVISLFARSGTESYSHSLARYQRFFRSRFPGALHEIIVIDNTLPPEMERKLPDNVILTGSAGMFWEFSSWSEGLERYRGKIETHDLVAFATSAFENEPNDYLNQFNMEAMDFAAQRGCALGYINASPWFGNYDVDGMEVLDYLRTSFLMMAPALAYRIGSFISKDDPELIFSANPEQPFLPECNISEDYQERIRSWLCGGSKRFTARWHGCFTLTEATMTLFIAKGMAIINESMLSARLRASGIPLVDIFWLNSVLSTGAYPDELPEAWVQRYANAGFFDDKKREPPSMVEAAVSSSDQETAHLGGHVSPCPPIPAPRVLFIDRTIPTPDQDAGSACQFGLMRIFVDLGAKVDLVVHDFLAKPKYAAMLEDAGIHCFSKDEAEDIEKHLRQNGQAYELIIFMCDGVAILYYSSARKHAPQAKLLFYMPDLNFLRMGRQAAYEKNDKLLAKAKIAKENALNIMRKCDYIIPFGDYEISVLTDLGLKKKIYNVVTMMVKPQDQAATWKERRDIMFIGGFGHPANIDAANILCKEIMPLVRKKIPNMRLHIIGANMPDSIRKLGREPGIITHGYIENLEYPHARCRLFVAPLPWGAGVKGKIVKSISTGLPVVTSPIGAESMPHGPGTGILVARTPIEFATQIINLYTNSERWNRESAGAIETTRKNYTHEIVKLRYLNLLRKLGFEDDFITWSLRSISDYNRLKETAVKEYNDRDNIALLYAQNKDNPFFIMGYCSCCGKQSSFRINAPMESRDKTGKLNINWRESIQCVSCGFNNRQRAAIHYLFTRLRPNKNAKIYITEAVTPLYRYLKEWFPGLIGSEYLGNECEFGKEKNLAGKMVRNEDMTALTFPDKSFDLAISLDVLEHVSNHNLALSEMRRILKPGGVLLFTAPFIKTSVTTLKRAEIGANGEIIHHLPPEIHGNPLDSKGGSLSFRSFGWDIIRDLNAAGFENAHAEACWSRKYAILGPDVMLFVARRDKNKA